MSSSCSTNTSTESAGNSSTASDSRYNMCAMSTPELSNRSTGRKCTVVNYKELGTQDSGHDSDYEMTKMPPQPLDNKSYPSVSRIATQHVIENNKANKQPKCSEDSTLPEAMEPIRKSPHTGDNNSDGNKLLEAIKANESSVVPDTTSVNKTVLPDKTTNKPNTKLPDATEDH